MSKGSSQPGVPQLCVARHDVPVHETGNPQAVDLGVSGRIRRPPRRGERRPPSELRSIVTVKIRNSIDGRIAALVILAFALIAAACGTGDGGDDVLGLGDRDLDRCSLISAQEAEQWLGGTVSAAPAEGIDGEPDPITCLYQVEGSPNSVFLQVYDGEVFFAEPGSAARTGETLEGLGEDAWTKEGDVNFLQNDWTVSVSRITGLVSDANLLEMAELISSRLP